MGGNTRRAACRMYFTSSSVARGLSNYSAGGIEQIRGKTTGEVRELLREAAYDEVITVSHSYIATANVVRYCNAEPVFVDVDRESAAMDPAAAAAFNAQKDIAGAVSWAPDIYNLADTRGNRLRASDWLRMWIVFSTLKTCATRSTLLDWNSRIALLARMSSCGMRGPNKVLGSATWIVRVAPTDRARPSDGEI